MSFTLRVMVHVHRAQWFGYMCQISCQWNFLNCCDWSNWPGLISVCLLSRYWVVSRRLWRAPYSTLLTRWGSEKQERVFIHSFCFYFIFDTLCVFKMFWLHKLYDETFHTLSENIRTEWAKMWRNLIKIIIRNVFCYSRCTCFYTSFDI